MAPIQSVEFLVLESWPPQYAAVIVSALPNGCAEFDRYEVTAEDHTIRIAIYNLVQVGVECTEIYRTVEHTIPLGKELQPETSYTVVVNDVAKTLVTQPGPPTPTVQATPTQAPPEPTATAVPQPPAGFQLYEDPAAGVALFYPEGWFVTQVQPGQSAILQSYPEDKYVGGEARQPGDTKCDLSIRPADVSLASYLDQVGSDPASTLVAQDEVVLQSGERGVRLEVDSMGRSVSLVTEVNGRVLVLTCFGEAEAVDTIGATIHALP